MGFGGHLTLDASNVSEKLYQNVKGDNPTRYVRFVKVIADANNTGTTIIGPFREVSASDPIYGDYELDPGHVAWIEGTDGDLVDLEEWWAATTNTGNKLRWSVAIGGQTQAETVVV